MTLPDFEDHGNQRKVCTTCYMCACRCGIKVTLENEKIRFIEGNPNHPVNKGVLCGKGNAGIMKQLSPAKLKAPLLRKKDSARGEGVFEEISWDQALNLLTQRLKDIRQSDPNKLAYFTGRDQMQALTGLWAQQFGTVNWAAHGGFCSVNMAAAGLYTTGFSFWEFGDPDWEHTKYFMMWGVAEDHSSNPIKIGLSKLKKRGVKFVSINPIRTGYQAIADEWIAIKPGTDGMLAMAMIHVLLKNKLFDDEFLVRYSNSCYLIIDNPGQANHGLIYRDDDNNPQVWDQKGQSFLSANAYDSHPALIGEYQTNEGLKLKTAFTLFAERYLDDAYSPQSAEKICNINADVIERLTMEMAHVAFQETIEIPINWTDSAGRKHDKFIGRPVSMHAMRGISAHSNGFQTCRAIHLLQMLLGTIDVPGGHRAKSPFPKQIPPPNRPATSTKANSPASTIPLGFPISPEDLAIDEKGQPLRIDKAFSWDAPLAIHGMMHNVIANAVNQDPYAIDTLIFFMANMSWNSSMNTAKTREMLVEKNDDGDYRIPFIVAVDAFHSEMVNFADLVLPDTTYLERFDTISMLDRPISDPDLVCDAIRQPVITPKTDVRPWQEVMIELANRLEFPAFTNEDGSTKFKDYQDFIVNYEKSPGIGFLAGWRGKDGKTHFKGEPNPNQWQAYIDNECFFSEELPESMRYYKHANQDYLKFAQQAGFNPGSEQIVMQLYSETLQKFRLAGLGLYDGPQPKNEAQKKRLATFCDPLPFYYPTLENEQIDKTQYPLYALTQRPMAMYHSWDSQNAWLRQIMAENYLYIHANVAESMSLKDDDWVWVYSHNGKIKVKIKVSQALQEDTVWTWNAIGKQTGTWGLTNQANESNVGFLLNHLISESLPDKSFSNSDPITGQAAWYDLRVKIEPAINDDDKSWPQFSNKTTLPTSSTIENTVCYKSHDTVNIKRPILDILLKGYK